MIRFIRIRYADYWIGFYKGFMTAFEDQAKKDQPYLVWLCAILLVYLVFFK